MNKIKVKRMTSEERAERFRKDHEVISRAAIAAGNVTRSKLSSVLVESELFRGQARSLWNFWEHGVTSSFLSSFLSCREQTRLSYVEGLTSRHTPLAFEFGTCCHWVLEQAYSRLQVMPVYPQPGAEMVKGWIKQYEKKWLKDTPDPIMRQLEQQELVYGLAEAVLPSYFNRWAGDFNGGTYVYGNTSTAPKKWVNLEEVFNIPYTFSDGRVCPRRGRRDGVFRDRRGKLWVFDTKCRSIINHEDALDTLPSDLQQMFYSDCTETQYGETPAGVIMNIIRRPGQRRGKDESLKAFCERVRKEVENPKNFDHYFVRYELVLDKNDLDEWRQKMLNPLMDDVRAWWEGRAPHYMNPNALISKYGRCPLFLPIVKNDTSMCFRRKKCFSELD